MWSKYAAKAKWRIDIKSKATSDSVEQVRFLFRHELQMTKLQSNCETAEAMTLWFSSIKRLCPFMDTLWYRFTNARLRSRLVLKQKTVSRHMLRRLQCMSPLLEKCPICMSICATWENSIWIQPSGKISLTFYAAGRFDLITCVCTCADNKFCH